MEIEEKKFNGTRNIILLGTVSLFIDMSTEMVYPIMPMFLLALGAAPSVIGLIEGVTEGLATVLRVFAGYVSDKTKKTKLLVTAGYSSAFLYKIGILLSTGWVGIFISKLVDRTGKGLRTAPRDSLIADSVSGGLGKGFGLHKTLDKLGGSLGALFAFLLIYFSLNFNTVFYLSIIPAVLGVALLAFVKEKKKEPSLVTDKKEKIQPSLSLKGVKLGKKLWLYLAFVFIFSMGNSSNAFLLLRAQASGFDQATVILLYFTYNMTASILSIPLGKLSDKINRKYLIIAAYLLYGAIYLGFGLIAAPSAFWVLFVLYGVYTALIGGSERALVVEMSPKEFKGTALGLQGMMQGVGLLVSSLLAGLLWDYAGDTIPFLFGAGAAFVAAVGMIFFAPTKRRGQCS